MSEAYYDGSGPTVSWFMISLPSDLPPSLLLLLLYSSPSLLSPLGVLAGAWLAGVPGLVVCLYCFVLDWFRNLVPWSYSCSCGPGGAMDICVLVKRGSGGAWSAVRAEALGFCFSGWRRALAGRRRKTW